MNTKHTPGPLTVARDQTYRAQWTVVRSHGHQPNAEQAGVGHVMATARCYTEADAILYAASPELLEALAGCITSEGAACFMENHPEWMQRRLYAISDIARAAISKATGGTK